MLASLALALAPLLQETAAATPARAPAPALRAEDLARWRAHLRPTEDELAFERIPWIPDLASGLARAGAAERPILLWAMNGHPLGCT